MNNEDGFYVLISGVDQFRIGYPVALFIVHWVLATELITTWGIFLINNYT